MEFFRKPIDLIGITCYNTDLIGRQFERRSEIMETLEYCKRIFKPRIYLGLTLQLFSNIFLDLYNQGHD